MSYIYIAFVNTPGVFAWTIHKYIKQKYIHVVISVDENLEEAYSVGRRNPFIPFFSGFEKENKNRIYKAFPEAEYMVCRLEVSQKQKDRIVNQLRNDYCDRFKYHYAIIGLIPIVLGIPFYQKNHYTCSSYIAKLLYENNIYISKKHFSLVTPRDFYLYENKEILFEGKLENLIDNIKCCQLRYRG